MILDGQQSQREITICNCYKIFSGRRLYFVLIKNKLAFRKQMNRSAPTVNSCSDCIISTEKSKQAIELVKLRNAKCNY